MPGLVNNNTSSRKRKRTENTHSNKKSPTANPGHTDFQSHIEKLEKQALNLGSEESVSALFGLLESASSNRQQAAVIAISLCRIFTKQMISGSGSATPPNELENAFDDKFGTLYREYQEHILHLIRTSHPSHGETFMELYMHLLKAEAEYLGRNTWKKQQYYRLCETLVQTDDHCPSRRKYTDDYLKIYHDCQYYFFKDVSAYLAKPQSGKAISQSISMLAALDNPPKVTADFPELFIPLGQKSKKDAITLAMLKRAAEGAWLAVLRQPSLSRSTRKIILRLIAPVITPWFNRPEQLMDFLTDSYNQGGTDALLALSGLYQLISTKNLDYPSFYPKLYSLIDSQLLHSAYRSRFFRLLQTFLSSTHLPATLIASFIKRLARLSLFAPPSAIITVIPYTYNLLKNNPATTFMLHRKSPATVFEDPFDPNEPDPQHTNAIDSSLWELETLQSHYHPNVASIARIISEQFTKQQYNLEDFLDHSYSSMIEAELARKMKKTPVVEWKIPKRILTSENESVLPESEAELMGATSNEMTHNLVSRLWSFA